MTETHSGALFMAAPTAQMSAAIANTIVTVSTDFSLWLTPGHARHGETFLKRHTARGGDGVGHSQRARPPYATGDFALLQRVYQRAVTARKQQAQHQHRQEPQAGAHD
jgi:hypothetical protein